MALSGVTQGVVLYPCALGFRVGKRKGKALNGGSRVDETISFRAPSQPCTFDAAPVFQSQLPTQNTLDRKLFVALSFSQESLNALKPLFPLLQKKAISRILDHGYSVVDSPKANQSLSKVDKPLTKEQEEDKVSKKGNKKVKQTSEKPPHCRSEGRSKQKSSSLTVKKKKDVSPSTSLTLSSNNTAVITKTITRTLPLKQKMHCVNVKAQDLQNINKQSKSIKDLEIQLLQVECEELKIQLGCLREGLMGQKPGNVEELLKQSQKELLWLQRQLSFISAGGPAYVLAASKEGNGNTGLGSKSLGDSVVLPSTYGKSIQTKASQPIYRPL
ncbi:uncharacterized protein [Phaenicophaeus curvirostris]|uniref:uncharacterized protein n=1 Tax=Phaenicophaeus curvirostris TaxID=33595 RepID=UPI0037F0CEE6